MKLISYRTKADAADRNAELIRAVFAELATVRPPGLKYAVYQDGVQFVHIADGDGLTSLPAFRAFTEGHGDRCEAPPTFTEPQVLGAYDGS